MSDFPHAARYYVPYVRPFRLLKWGPRHDIVDGTYVDDGWYVDRYGKREITREQAEEIWRREHEHQQAS
jgi:hypothetical protein